MVVISIGEQLDKATGLIVEAEKVFDDGVREKMIAESYLGELQEVLIFKKALVNAEKAVEILTFHNGRMLPTAEELVVKLKKKINEIEKPKVLKSVKEPKVKTVRVPRRMRRGVS